MRCNDLILDCDGVLFDTNGLKEANIREAASLRSTGERLDRFVRYFTDNNGVPREAKVHRWFPDTADAAVVLEAYNALNRDSLATVDPLPGAQAFVEAAARSGFRLHVLSGGAQVELGALFERTGLKPLFDNILGGPTSKVDHLGRLELTGRTCYFGDSRHDYEAARHAGIDFVFLHRYSQFTGWQSFFETRPHVRVKSHLDQSTLDLCYESESTASDGSAGQSTEPTTKSRPSRSSR